MYHLRARYMNPDTGRFWSRDTYEGDQFDPLSLHKYSYVSGNPVNGVDPSGRMGEYSIGGLMVATAMLATIATLSVIAFQQTRELFTDSTPLADFLPQLKPEVTPQQQPEPTPQPGTRPRIPPPDEDDDLKLHRGSIQAQGAGISFGNNYVDLGDGVIGNKDTISWKWAQFHPLTLVEGLAGLQAVESKLTKSQLRTRDQAFIKARNFVVAASGYGLPPKSYTFRNNEVQKRRGDERVDIVVSAGLAFVQ